MIRAAVLAFAIAAAAILSFRPIYEPDLWWHLAHGRENAAGRLVRTNVFSFTYPEYRQRYTSWLFDTSAYLSWRAGGPAAVQVLQAVFIAASLLVLFAACRQRAPAWSGAAVLMLGFFVLEPRAIPRPHLVSFAGLAGCAYVIEGACSRRSNAPLWYAAGLIAVWSNFHVECVFGVLLLGVFAVSEAIGPARITRRQAFGALAGVAAAALATMANPYGGGLLAYLYENLSVPDVLAIAELLPPRLPAYAAFYLLLALTAMLLILEPRRIALSEAAVFVVFAVLGVKHLRETPLVLFAAGPILASRLERLTARGIDYRAILVTMVCASLAVTRIPLRLLVTEFSVGAAAVQPDAFFPRGAVDFAKRAGLEGPVFNSHNLGGYLAWAMYPQVRTFQDSRLQAYPPEHFRAIIEASRSQEAWNALVAGVDWAVVSIRRPNQLSGTSRFPVSEWRTVYQDDAIGIVVRKNGRFDALVR